MEDITEVNIKDRFVTIKGTIYTTRVVDDDGEGQKAFRVSILTDEEFLNKE